MSIKGKIYAVVCNITGKQYVGSTEMENYEDRLIVHHTHHLRWKKGKAQYTAVFDILDGGDYKIVLLQNYECNTNEELRIQEQWWMDNIEGGCINKNRAYTSVEQQEAMRKIKTKEWQDKIIICQCGKEVRQGYYKAHISATSHPQRVKEEQERQPKKWKSFFVERQQAEKDKEEYYSDEAVRQRRNEYKRNYYKKYYSIEENATKRNEYMKEYKNQRKALESSRLWDIDE